MRKVTFQEAWGDPCKHAPEAIDCLQDLAHAKMLEGAHDDGQMFQACAWLLEAMRQKILLGDSDGGGGD